MKCSRNNAVVMLIDGRMFALKSVVAKILMSAELFKASISSHKKTFMIITIIIVVIINISV